METQIKLAILLALSLSQHCPRHLKSGILLIYNLCFAQPFLCSVNEEILNGKLHFLCNDLITKLG